MSTSELLNQIHRSPPQMQRLVERLLSAPEHTRQALGEALAEIECHSPRGQFLEQVMDWVVDLSKQVNIPVEEQPGEAFATLVKVFTQPEALSQLAPQDPLAAARLKGVMVKQQLLYAGGPPLSSAEVAQMLGISRQAVDQRRLKGKLLAVSLGRRGYRYPHWQFQDGHTLPGMERVLAALQDADAWTQLMFLMTGDLRLGGQTPLECLQRGDIEAVVEAAASYGNQGAA
jgi:biotin operon repressor